MPCPFSSPADDPFKQQREGNGVLPARFQGETVPMILRYKEVRAATANWQTFSSDAPFRVPIPSEEDVRTVRQLPIETDPPDHKEWRLIVDPFFRRPREPWMVEKVDALIGELLDAAVAQDRIEIVREFALPLQSRALTYLLGVPESEAEEWISWGTHVFRDGSDGTAKGETLNRYIQHRIDAALADPGEDFFSALTRARFQDRPLTRDEITGFANLTFAGGRDTIIQSVASVFGYFSERPGELQMLRHQPENIMSAAEEFFRFVSPLTHIGRVCPDATQVGPVEVPPGGRISLCWASANRDPSVFDAPDTMKLDRKPNPHIAFGSGHHLCLGAMHARLLIRTLLALLCERIERIEPLDAAPHLEREEDYVRRVGYESLEVRLVRKEQPEPSVTRAGESPEFPSAGGTTFQ